MNKIKSVIIVSAFLAAGSFAFIGCKSGHPHSGGSQTQYTCSMHPDVLRAAAGACLKCGMKLEEKQ